MNKSNITKFILILFFFSLTNLISGSLNTVEPDEILDNPEYELRARNISKNIRCVVCQNQSIDESNAPLAKDLRILIRNKIKEGDKDEEIYNFLTERYGEFILLNPPFNLKTLALWFLPIIFIILGVYTIFYNNKKSAKS